MATQVVELSGDEAALLRSFDRAVKKAADLEAKLRDGGAAGDAAGTAVEEALRKVEEANQKALKAMLADLKSMGPEGRQAAEELRAQLVKAGQLSEKSMEDVVKVLKHIDPESAKAADAIIANIKRGAAESQVELTKAAESSDDAFAKFGQNALGQITGLVGGYVTLQGAVQLVTGFLEHQVQLLDKSREAAINLATIQQETVKNLIGSDAITQSSILRTAIPQIARDTGFSDLSALTSAVGAGVSTGGTNEEVLAAVRESAKLNRLTPQNLDSSVQAAILINQATGQQDPRQSLNLLLSAGDPALISDPGKLAKLLPTAIGNTVPTTSDANKPRAAQEATALFAALTKAAGDREGDSTVTNQITFATYLREFFKGRENDPGTLFGRIQAVQADPAMREKFLDKLPGEAKFKIGFEQLVTPGSDVWKSTQDAFGKVSGGTDAFDRTVRQVGTATPALAIANAESAVNAAINAQKATDDAANTLSSVRRITADALTNAQSGLFGGGMGQSMFDSRIQSGILSGSDALSESVSAISAIESRKRQLAEGGITSSEQKKIATLDAAIAAIQTVIASNLEHGVFSPGEIAAGRSAAQSQLNVISALETYGLRPEQKETQRIFQEMLDRLDKIAASNATMASAPPPQATPAVTPALGALQP